MLELKPSGLTNRFRRLKQPSDTGAIEATLTDRMQHREKRDLQRLGEVVELATSTECQASLLSAHFGEPLDEPCGHCSACIRKSEGGDATGEPPSSTGSMSEISEASIDEALWQEATTLRETERATLASPQRFTKFLCGISSPKLTRAKLSRHDLFGIFEHVPFQQILERARQNVPEQLEEPAF